MKKKGSVCEFNEDRDKELLKVYRRELRNMQWTRLSEVFQAVANSAASRFYVSEIRAQSVIRHRLRTGNFPVLAGKRLEMFEEIWRRYCEMRTLHPDLSDADIIYDVVNSPAPSFYLTTGTIRVKIYEALAA